MRTAIAVLRFSGPNSPAQMVLGYDDRVERTRARISDAVANGELPPDVQVFRLPRRLDVGYVRGTWRQAIVPKPEGKFRGIWLGDYPAHESLY